MRIQGLVVERPSGFRLGPLHVEGPDDRPWLLLGPRGAGKTTLLLALAGRAPVREGVIEGPPGHGVAYLPQFPERVLAGRNLAEDLTGFVRPDSTARRRIAEALDDVGLASARMSRPARDLSGGERRRVALALLLVSPYRDWAVDEPDAGLDEAGRARVAALIAGRIAGGGRVWIATHRPRIYAPLRPFCLLLSEGAVVAAGPLAAMGGSARLRCLAGTSRAPVARFWSALREALPDLPPEDGEMLRNYVAPIPQVHEILTDSVGLG